MKSRAVARAGAGNQTSSHALRELSHIDANAEVLLSNSGDYSGTTSSMEIFSVLLLHDNAGFPHRHL